MPRLFFGKYKSLLPIVVTLSTMMVKTSGLGLQDPVTSANKKYLILMRASSKAIISVMVAREFSTADNLLALREERRDGQKIQDDANVAKLKGLVDDLEASDRRLIIRAKKKGYYLTLRGTTVTSTLLAATEFRDFCANVMMLPPPPPPLTLKKSEGCSHYFSIRHIISCSNGGLIISQHKEV